MSILSIIFVIIPIVYIIKYFWSRRWLYYSSTKIHGPSPAWPLIGNAFYFAGGTDDILENIIMLFKKFKSPFRVWLGNRLFFGVSQPKDVEIVLNKCLAKEQLYNFTTPVVGTGLFTAPVDKWRRHRKIILPTFNQQILNTFVPIFAKHSDILVENFEKEAAKGYFDLFPSVSRCSFDIICETALGISVHTESKSGVNYATCIGRSMEIVFQRMFQIWLHPDCIWNLSPLSTELKSLYTEMNLFGQAIVAEKKDEYKKLKQQDQLFKQTKRKAFLDYLIELSEEGAHLTDEEILEETQTITIAGSDTTSTMVSFALIMLGMHPEVQHKVWEELDVIFGGDSTRKITFEDLSHMTYLEKVIKETLRLFPAGPVIVRSVDEDIQLASYVLPKGSSCVLGIIHTHRDPEIWDEPLKFNPDRFLPEEVTKRHPYAYIPFSGGPRNCIGPRYAMMAIKVIVSSVIRRFKITKTDFENVEDIKIKADIVIKSVYGYNAVLELRNK